MQIYTKLMQNWYKIGTKMMQAQAYQPSTFLEGPGPLFFFLKKKDKKKEKNGKRKKKMKKK